jgi:tetratricopeptide (TPR) repeat protein
MRAVAPWSRWAPGICPAKFIGPSTPVAPSRAAAAPMGVPHGAFGRHAVARPCHAGTRDYRTAGAKCVMPTQTFTLLISLCAFLVSLYSMIERRLELHRGLRFRLGQVADTLNELKVTEESTDPDDLSAINFRRELLIHQAVSLVGSRKWKRAWKLSSIEYRAIAWAASDVNDAESARRFFELALQSAETEGATAASYAYKGYADFLFSMGEVDAGRQMYKKAMEVNKPPMDSWAKIRVAETAVNWAGNEFNTLGGSEERAEELFQQAEKLAKSLPKQSEADAILQFVRTQRLSLRPSSKNKPRRRSISRAD